MALPSETRISFTAREGGSWLGVSGEIDISTESDLELALLQASEARELVLDLRSLRFCSARGLWLIDRWVREQEARGRSVHLLMRPQEVRLHRLLHGTTNGKSPSGLRMVPLAISANGHNQTRTTFNFEIAQSEIASNSLIEAVHNAIAEGEQFLSFDLRSLPSVPLEVVDLLSEAVAACAQARVGVEILGQLPINNRLKVR